jgi:hypothetical protein
VKQVVIHPGEVNIIKKHYIDSRWVATHADSAEVFVWNLDKHKHIPSSKENIPANTPELM